MPGSSHGARVHTASTDLVILWELFVEGTLETASLGSGGGVAGEPALHLDPSPADFQDRHGRRTLSSSRETVEKRPRHQGAKNTIYGPTWHVVFSVGLHARTKCARRHATLFRIYTTARARYIRRYVPRRTSWLNWYMYRNKRRCSYNKLTMPPNA